MSPERRQSARSDIFLIVEFRPLNSTSAYFQGVTENISLEGLSLDSTSHHSRIKEILELKLKIPHNDLYLSLQGEIIWKRELWYKCVTGVKFKDVDKDIENKIIELVSVARSEHEGSSVHGKEDKKRDTNDKEKVPAAAPGSGKEKDLQQAALKEDNNADFKETEKNISPPEELSGADSRILNSIDKVSDKTESANRTVNQEMYYAQARDLKLKEAEGKTLKVSGKRVSSIEAPAEARDQRTKNWLFISFTSFIIIAAAVVLSFKFEDIKQLFITYTSTDSVLSQDSTGRYPEGSGGGISSDIMTEPEPVEQMHVQEISDVDSTLPEEEKTEDSEPTLSTDAIIHDDDSEQPLVAVDSVQPDRSATRKERFLISNLDVTITFAKNSAAVNPWFYTEIDKISNALFNYPESEVKVTGHTDSIGSASYNMDLSLRRAAAVKDLLVQKGIDASRIEVIGLWYSSPANSNNTESGRIGNRRVEMKIIPYNNQLAD